MVRVLQAPEAQDFALAFRVDRQAEGLRFWLHSLDRLCRLGFTLSYFMLGSAGAQIDFVGLELTRTEGNVWHPGAAL